MAKAPGKKRGVTSALSPAAQSKGGTQNLIPWKPGQSGNKAGKKPGTLNKATRTMKDFCQSLFNDKEFQKNFIRQWRDLTLDPQTRQLVLYYGFGKPATSIDLSVTFDHAGYLARLSEPAVLDGELADD